MANSIEFTRNYTSVIDEVYKRAAVSGCLNSPRRMVRAGRNAKEIMIPKIEVTGLGGLHPQRGLQDRGRSPTGSRRRRSTTTAGSGFSPT